MSASTTSTQPTLTAEAYYDREIEKLNLAADNIRTIADNADKAFSDLGDKYTGTQESQWQAAHDRCKQAIDNINEKLEKLYIAQNSHAGRLRHAQQVVEERSTQPKSHASVRDLS